MIKLLMNIWSYSFFLLILIGCGQKASTPVEIVRVSNRGSVMEKMAPVINRGGSGNVLIVSDNLNNEQIDSHLEVAGDRKIVLKKGQHQPLYVSGPKAKQRQAIKNRFVKSSLHKKEKINAKNSGDRIIQKNHIHPK